MLEEVGFSLKDGQYTLAPTAPLKPLEQALASLPTLLNPYLNKSVAIPVKMVSQAVVWAPVRVRVPH
jgi:hypothetical protein